MKTFDLNLLNRLKQFGLYLPKKVNKTKVCIATFFFFFARWCTSTDEEYFHRKENWGKEEDGIKKGQIRTFYMKEKLSLFAKSFLEVILRTVNVLLVQV